MAGTINAWNNQIAAASTAITLNSGTNAISISTDASATTVNIGTGAAVKGVTIGSTNSSSALTLKCGSSGMKAIGVASVAVSNKNYLSINTSTGALGSDVGPGGQSIPVLLNTITATGVTTPIFTSTYITSTYPVYLLLFNSLFAGSFGASKIFQITFSTDNGSTYLNTNYQCGNNSAAYNSNTWTNANSSTSAPLAAPTANPGFISGYIYLYGLAASVSGAPSYSGCIVVSSGSPSVNIGMNIVAGNITGAPNVNNIKINTTTGATSFASGSVSLYGITQ